MYKEQEEEIITSAIDHYGFFGQFCKMSEEVGELLQAMNKLKSEYDKQVFTGVYPQDHYPIEYCVAYWNLCSEVADVKILIKIFEKMLGKDSVILAEERKLLRLEQRIKNEVHTVL